MRFSDEETSLLETLFSNHEMVSDIAKIMGRSRCSIVDKIHKMGLKRDKSIVLLMRNRGTDVLKLGGTSIEIKKALKAERRAALEQRWADQAEHEQVALAQLRIDLGRMGRNDAVKIAYAHGARCGPIGKVIGLTRQGVALIVKGTEREHCFKGIRSIR